MQSSYSNYSAHGVYLKLSDGSIIKDENARVNCSYVGGNSYLIVGVLELDEDMIQQLSKNTIVKYSMISIEKPYKEKEGDKMMHYFQCMFEDILAK